ncbi:MAG: DNA mismatch repair endonuclease MutL [Owenweeksia sp.]
MPDVIHLLPDSVANQIAAGEVVQRPASAVKELLENAIDAGADEITLVIKEAGKTYIQIIDNGKGMSETDTRMSFERHATSKIKSAEDIFSIHTKGFRGEALASIAAVAQVELRTRQEKEELGTCLKIEGSTVKSQEFCNTPRGTQIEVKNLFYNIPARRNFLKSDNVELRHIIDEFQRVAIPHAHIQFTFVNGKSELFDLPKAGLRQRIVNIFGKKFNEKLVPVDEKTPILKLHGFIGKPEFARKTRGEQFFFTNDRFIKNGYLHKAVCNAFEGLLQDGSHPTYFLFLEIDPARIDVNIHPTKTEIKFEDEKAIHIIIRTAVKHALGQYNIAPTLDFETDQQFNMPSLPKGTRVEAPGITVDPTFNPFEDRRKGQRTAAITPNRDRPATQDWESLMNDLPEIENTQQQEQLAVEELPVRKYFTQVGKKYILTSHGSGMIMIHQQRAHERISFERLMVSLENKNIPSQQLLFPQNLSFTSSDFQVMQALMPQLREMGFDIDEFGSQEVVVNGIPLALESNNIQLVFEELIENEKDFRGNERQDHLQKMARILAKVSAIKVGKKMEQEEMHHLVDELFACSSPYVSLTGKPVIVNLNLEDIDKSFN